MKKILSLMLAAMMLLSMLVFTGCSNEPETQDPETVTIKALNANKELTDITVPYNPERICVLDMAALDIIDSLGLGDRIVGSAKVTIEYLTQYNPDDSNGKIANCGSVKTADMEQVAACAPDVIFIGGRLSKSYADLEKIAPVVYLAVDYSRGGVVMNTKENATAIATMFGKTAEVDAKFDGFQTRIDALNKILKGKEMLLCMYNNNALSVMATESQLNFMVNELGGIDKGAGVVLEEKPAHGTDAGWETIVNIAPEYMFVLDRSTATGAADEGVLGAREVIENDLVKEMQCYKDGKIVYFIQHANVWYTSTGGVQALDTMIADLEAALLK